MTPTPRQTPPEPTPTDPREHALHLHRKGVSTRDVKALVTEAYGSEQKGTSKTSVSRHSKHAGGDAYQRIMSRRFDDPEKPPVVALAVDGTGIGPKNNKRTILILVAIRADGTKETVSVWPGQDERTKDVAAMFRDAVERGVDPRALVIIDGGAGLMKGLEAISRANNMQLCTVHAARKIVATLPEAEAERTRKELYEAWWEDSADIALSRLTSIADRLEAEGHKAAAGSLRWWMEGTVTVNRLGIPRELRRQLRTTNQLESTNSAVKALLPKTKFWRGDPHRLRAVAAALEVIEKRAWTRLANPEGLVNLLERLMPGKRDPEEMLAQVPPNARSAHLGVPFKDADGKLALFAQDWCERSLDANWEGSAEILERLGLSPGEPVEPEQLVKAMQCRDPKTDKPMRSSRIGPNSSIPGVKCLTWELDAPPMMQREWRDAEPARRAEIEADLRQAGPAVIEVLTSTTRDDRGYAGVTALDPDPGRDGEEPKLTLRGIVVAVARGEGNALNSPAPDNAVLARTVRAAEDAAKEALDSGLRKLRGGDWRRPRRRPRRPARSCSTRSTTWRSGKRREWSAWSAESWSGWPRRSRSAVPSWRRSGPRSIGGSSTSARQRRGRSSPPAPTSPPPSAKRAAGGR